MKRKETYIVDDQLRNELDEAHEGDKRVESSDCERPPRTMLVVEERVDCVGDEEGKHRHRHPLLDILPRVRSR